MTVRRMTLTASLVIAMLGLGAAPALAAPSAGCFLSANWNGWKSPSPSVIYLRVNARDIYRVDLSTPSTTLSDPDVHLVNVLRGSDWVCTPLDLQLHVVDDFGTFREPLIVKSITRLTPEEAEAIPAKFRP